MSNSLLTNIRENIPEVRGPSRAVLMALADRANDSGKCWPSLATIAKDAGVCLSTVKTALRKLRSGGFITWTNTTTEDGDAGTNNYQLTVWGRAGDAPPKAGDAQRRTAPAPRVRQEPAEGRAGDGHKASMEAQRETLLALDAASPDPPTGNRKRPNMDQAEAIYQAYPRKEKKPPALKSISKALDDYAPDFLLERTKAYAAAIAWQERQFIPLPASWFNAEQFNDDPENWKQPGKKKQAFTI